MSRLNTKFLHLVIITTFLVLFAVNANAQEVKPTAELNYHTPQSIEDYTALESQIIKIVEDVRPAVVGVRIGSGSGSGTILTEDGWVITAAHVTRWKAEVPCKVILWDGTILSAVSKGYNRALDFALIKAEVPKDLKLKTIKPGNSDEMKVGRWVISMGHPLGFFTNPTRPPVVRVGRVVMRHRMIVSDAPLISGDSGGPMFNLDGEIVGVNVSISITNAKINNTTCINPAMKQLEDLKAGKSIGTSGASVSGYDRGIESAYKILDNAVKDKKEESFKKAVEAFDQVIKLDEKFPDGYYHKTCVYTRWMATLKDDAREKMKQTALAQLRVAFEKGWRNFQHMASDPDMKIIRSTDEYIALIKEFQKEGEAFFGISVQNLTQAEKTMLGIEAGIKISEVVAKGPAEIAGLKTNDIILAVGEKVIKETTDLKNHLLKLKPGQKIKLKILRAKEEKLIDMVLGGKEKPKKSPIQTSSLDKLLYKEGAKLRNVWKTVTAKNKVYESVVRITAMKKLLGYGVIVKEDGYIIAKNSQCILKKANYPDIEIELFDGRKFKPALLNESVRYDLALLKIEAVELKPVVWGSSANYKIGEFVSDIGTTDTPIALGVLSLFKYESNVGAKKPGLGIQGQDLKNLKAQGLPIDKGVLIAQVTAGSGASTAKLRAGDIIFDIDDEPIENLAQLKALLAKREVGDKIWVSVYREGEKLTKVVTLGELKAQTQRKLNPYMERIFGPKNKNSQGYGEVIQHDSVLNPNSTGSLLVNLKGEVIGMNISRVERTRTYALPADVLKNVVPQLIENQREVTPPDVEVDPEDEPIEEDF